MIKIKVYDIETYLAVFYYLDFDPITGEYVAFEISENRNDLFKLVKHLDTLRSMGYYMVGFNNVQFDFNVLQHIYDNHLKIGEMTNIEAAKYISEYGSNNIKATNSGGFPEYNEYQFLVDQIDLLKINHMDNSARFCSLKWLEYMMNAKVLEGTPVDFKAVSLTKKELEAVRNYCKNDVDNTYKFYLYTRGETSHEFYKGKDQILSRLTIIEKGILPKAAMNYSDSKIGDELNKIAYAKAKGIEVKDIYGLKKKRRPTKKFTFGDAIPDYVKFKTPEFIKFYQDICKVRVKLNGEEQEFPVTYNGTTYSIMLGGIHSVSKAEIIIPTANQLLKDSDVGAQYPHAIDKRGLYPAHLGEEWTGVMRETLDEKDFYKQSAKDAEGLEKLKLKGLEGSAKLKLNAGGYGKTGDNTNWQYGPEVMFYCTIGNQFEILMLIEMLELEKIHVIGANTDGILCLFDKSLEDTHKRICAEWEVIVGNSVRGKLEHTYFKALYQESVNHYIAVKEDDSLKIKGRFEIYGELHKNNSDKVSRIERLAVQEYFIKGIPVEKTIRECKDLHMFLIGKKGNKKYGWYLQRSDGKHESLDKVIRFYISNQGDVLLKMKNEGYEDETGMDVTRFFRGFTVNIANIIPEDFPQDINYNYYINNIIPVIENIEKKKYVNIEEQKQISMF